MKDALAYASGLFEGEGSCSVNRRTLQRGRPQPQIQIGMTDLEPLQKFIEGVAVPANICGPYHHAGGRKPEWRVTYSTFEKVQAVAAKMWPWLSPRRREQVRATLAASR